MWISDASVARWQNINSAIPENPSKFSNEPIDLTFVVGNDRVIYNAGGRFRGLWRGYGSPVNSGAYDSSTCSVSSRAEGSFPDTASLPA